MTDEDLKAARETLRDALAIAEERGPSPGNQWRVTEALATLMLCLADKGAAEYDRLQSMIVRP